MSFYNRYSPKPDWGGGIQDAVSQFMQFYMMKKMLGGDNQKQEQLITAMPQQNFGDTTQQQNVLNQAQTSLQASPQEGYKGPQISPQFLQMLMQYLMKARPGGGL